MVVSIAGALPYESATLLDGMPLIQSGTGTNLSFYPLNGFGSSDVVIGPSANAPSIVDSIGGSFILHPLAPVTHNGLNFTFTNDAYGGIITNGLAGAHLGKLSVVASYGINNSPGPLHSSNFYNQAAPTTIDGHAFKSYTPPCKKPGCQYGSLLVNPNYALNDGPYYGYQFGTFVHGFNLSDAWIQHTGSLGLNYAISPAINAGVIYTGQDAAILGLAGYESDVFIPPAGYSGSLAPGEYLMPSSGPGYTFRQSSSLLEQKITAQVGRGELRIAALQNRTTFNVHDTFPASAQFQLYGGGKLCSNTSPTCTGGTFQNVLLNGGTYGVTFPQSLYNQDNYTNNRDYLLSYSTPIGDYLHAGASFVTSLYNVPSQISISGSYSGYKYSYSFGTQGANLQVTNETRFFVGGYPSPKTSLDLSWYLTNANYHVQNPNDPTHGTYTDAVYSYAAPRLGFVWRPTASLAMRAAVGGGFAIAPVSSLIGTNGTPQLGCSNTCYTVGLTNLGLQPEKSFAFLLGSDIRVQRDTIASLDLYRANLWGQFYSQQSLTGTYKGLPLFTSETANLGQTRMEGILLDVRHSPSRGLYWDASGGLTRGFVVSVPSNFYDNASGKCNFKTATTPDGNTCPNLSVVPNVNYNGSFLGSVPYAQAHGLLGYRFKPGAEVGLEATYLGNNNTYFHPAFMTFALTGSYPLTKNVSLSAEFRNISGIYGQPIQATTYNGIIGAPTVAGLPYPLFGEEVGPRALLVTMSFHS
jgi:hypothetical protein